MMDNIAYQTLVWPNQYTNNFNLVWSSFRNLSQHRTTRNRRQVSAFEKAPRIIKIVKKRQTRTGVCSSEQAHVAAKHQQIASSLRRNVIVTCDRQHWSVTPNVQVQQNVQKTPTQNNGITRKSATTRLGRMGREKLIYSHTRCFRLPPSQLSPWLGGWWWPKTTEEKKKRNEGQKKTAN